MSHGFSSLCAPLRRLIESTEHGTSPLLEIGEGVAAWDDKTRNTIAALSEGANKLRRYSDVMNEYSPNSWRTVAGLPAIVDRPNMEFGIIKELASDCGDTHSMSTEQWLQASKRVQEILQNASRMRAAEDLSRLIKPSRHEGRRAAQLLRGADWGADARSTSYQTIASYDVNSLKRFGLQQYSPMGKLGANAVVATPLFFATPVSAGSFADENLGASTKPKPYSADRPISEDVAHLDHTFARASLDKVAMKSLRMVLFRTAFGTAPTAATDQTLDATSRPYRNISRLVSALNDRSNGSQAATADRLNNWVKTPFQDERASVIGMLATTAVGIAPLVDRPTGTAGTTVQKIGLFSIGDSPFIHMTLHDLGRIPIGETMAERLRPATLMSVVGPSTGAIAARPTKTAPGAAPPLTINYAPVINGTGLDERSLLRVLEGHAHELYRIITRQQERRERLRFK
jgi:hypothetical protein